MGKRGPKPAPTHLKLLRGDDERYVNREEPIPSDEGEVTPPEGIRPEALEVWNELAPDMIDKGVLTAWDVHPFMVFCTAVAVYRECDAKMGHNYTDRGAAGGIIKSPYWQIMRDCADTMAKYSSRFGLTPGDRADLKVGASDDGPSTGAERILG